MPPEKVKLKVGKKKIQKIKTLLQDSYTDDKILPKGIVKDRSLSGKRVSVYLDNNRDKVYVAHRGTYSAKDWLTDFAMAFGYEGGRRFRHSNKIQQKTEKKYGSGKVVTIGHSLGGRLAEKVGRNSSEIITYNKAATPRSIAETLIRPITGKQNDLRTPLDLVSIGAKVQRRSNDIIKITPKSSGPISQHGLDEL